MAAKIDGRAAWVEHAIGRELTDFQRRAVVLLCKSMCCGPYDFSRTFEKADWQYGRGVRFVVDHGRLATWDMAGLTTLVIGAHDECIRVEIRPVNFQNVAICMWPRQREGDISERHPTIERAIHYYRGTDPKEQPHDNQD